ncbi:DNA polymerase III PolC-type-like [Brachionichthys hirsutus]|uniref:DNA polymerase III PolC-type-like n=1 Tax=Brachionichthys hirsutus TaxID=412623 RepID=UPI003604C21D
MDHQYQTKVFFDLETTGLDTGSCGIIQLSAVCGARVFNAYTVPHDTITRSAASVTGFVVDNGKLFCRGKRMKTIDLHDLLVSFIDFLRSFPRPVLLVAHNARLFDAPVLTSALKALSLWREFSSLVTGFLDTFLLIKNVYRGLSSYSQPNLVQHFLGKSYNAHDALEDARALQDLLIHLNPSQHVIKRFLY